jgi:hypothetical protein
VLLFSLDRYQNRIDEDSLKYLETSLNNAINSCYGTEGKYPSNIQYLVDNYAVVYSKEKYLVFYETFGSNIRPNIKIIKRY